MGQLSSDSEPRDVLILGASARAAAMSAVRAGLRVWALDLFGDEDLVETAHKSQRITHYRDCLKVLPDWPMMPCLPTGALENHPHLIERLATELPFWGSAAQAIRKVRDSKGLGETLTNAGRPALKIWTQSTPPAADGRWMLKPKRSAGGQGIFVWDQYAAQAPEALATLNKPHVFQERAPGEAASAVFLSEWDRITFVGAARLLGANSPGPRFGYGGAVGPMKLSQDIKGELLETGRVIGEAFCLQGLWGLDFLHDGSKVWVTEVNPRYTATVELYEHAFGTALLPFHQRACEGWPPRSTRNRRISIASWPEEAARPMFVGKVVVYSPCDFVVPSWKEWMLARDGFCSELKILADRPAEGSLVPKGFPICSLFASGSSEHECRLALEDRTSALACHFKNSGVNFEFPN